MDFIEINSDNWEECVALHTNEDIYIASNLYSIAEAQFYDKAISRAISVNDEMIGYVMFGEDEERSEVCWIDRFMIGHRFRKKGHAIKALNLIIDKAKHNPQFKIVETSTDLKNLPMRSLLEKCGFKTENEIKDDEIVYFYDKI